MDSAIHGSDMDRVDAMDLMPVWCLYFEKCKQQIGITFGCIPLTTIKTYSGPHVALNKVPEVFRAYNLIKHSGLPNLLYMRIPVQTNLKVDNWRKYLMDYFDQQFPDLIEFGFPLSFDRNLNLVSASTNHPSAMKFVDHVDKYIKNSYLGTDFELHHPSVDTIIH